MRKHFIKFALATALGLASAFTLSCLDEKDVKEIVISKVVGLPSSSGGTAAAVEAQGGCPNTVTSSITVSCGFQTYKTVKIGKQIWMAKNLNYDVPDNGTDVCYGNVAANCVKYGRLYNWATAMALPAKCNNIRSTNDAACAITTPRHRGICPEGWHIPSKEEWDELIIVDNKPRYAELKAKIGWSDNGNGTDNYGFSAVPNTSAGNSVAWWSILEHNADYVASRSISSKNETPKSDDTSKSSFLSVRCIKD
ncbi:MAG: hypothetical protein FWF67_00335 [Fibromonadales bacterium]|nr:hypothetical protein [Fibromonadales bacterium]